MSEETVVVHLNSGSQEGASYLFDSQIDEDLKISLYGVDKAKWLKGDTVYIAINHSNNVVIDDVRSTAGTISEAGTSSRTRETEQLFKSNDPDKPTTLQLPVVGSYTYNTIGYSGVATGETDSKGITTLTGDVNYVPFRAAVSIDHTVKLFKVTIDSNMLVDGGYTFNVVFYITVS